MACIPTLSLKQLAILRLAKQCPGKTIRLFYETPVINNEQPPTEYSATIQKLLDLDLVRVQSTLIHCNFSRFQRNSWASFSADLEQPCIRDWEQWRDRFIARKKESERVSFPGKEFEDFSYVWIQEIGVQATQPSEDAMLK